MTNFKLWAFSVIQKYFFNFNRILILDKKMAKNLVDDGPLFFF